MWICTDFPVHINVLKYLEASSLTIKKKALASYENIKNKSENPVELTSQC